jgi:hypothetical protein
MCRGSPVKLFTALNRFMHRRGAQTPASPAPFDDGLVDIARLIAVDDPPAQPQRPAADSAEPSEVRSIKMAQQEKPALGASLGTESDNQIVK